MKVLWIGSQTLSLLSFCFFVSSHFLHIPFLSAGRHVCNNCQIGQSDFDWTFNHCNAASAEREIPGLWTSSKSRASKRNLLSQFWKIVVEFFWQFGFAISQYHGSIDFKTVNIYCTVGDVYFLVFPGNRDEIERHDLQYSIHSLFPRECIGKHW